MWDHTQDPATDNPLVSIPNDGRGVTVPGDVLDIMFQEAVDAFEAAGGTVDSRALNILADAAFEQIKEVNP
jgi:hypothetical protein